MYKSKELKKLNCRLNPTFTLIGLEINHTVFLQLNPEDEIISSIFPSLERREEFLSKFFLYKGLYLDRIPVIVQNYDSHTVMVFSFSFF